METIIVAFGYEARQGKDSAAKAIVEARGGQYDIRLYPFAKQLKLEFYAAAQNPLDPFWEWLYKATGKTVRFYDGIASTSQVFPRSDTVGFVPRPQVENATWEQIWQYCEDFKQELRYLLQLYGTEYRRNNDPFYWVRKTGEAIAADKPQFALITDMRFVNEAFFVKANKGYTVKVQRHGFNDLTKTGHASEHQLANFKFDIDITVLDGELEQLQRDSVTVFDMIVDWNTVPELKTEDFTEEKFEEVNG